MPTSRKYAVYLSLGLSAVLSCLAVPVGAQDTAKASDLVAAARAALGGEDKLKAIKALDVQGDFKRAAGQVTLEGDLQLRLQLPDKLRRDEDRKSTRLNSSHVSESRMPSSA